MFKIIKYLGLFVLLAGAVLILLNFDYFGKQIGFFFDQTFVTDTQREQRQEENRVVLSENELYIPSLDVRAPIQFVTKANETEFQAALANGVVQYPGTAEIGTVGNTYIFGHSSDFAFSKGKFKTVFALLPNIELGAEILVSNSQKNVYTYKVYEKFVAQKTDVHLLEQKTNGKKILTLQTSYPVGTALKRYIVLAEIVENK